MRPTTIPRSRRACLRRGGLLAVPASVTSLAVFASASVAAPPSVTVTCPSSLCGSSLIQAAIDSATTPSGAVIALGAGTYQGDVKIDKNVTLQGDSGTVTVDGDNSASNTGSTVRVMPGIVARIDGVTITGGYANSSTQWGGGISNDGSLTLSNSVVTGNNGSRGEGGGVFNDGTMSVVDSTLSNNTSLFAGAAANYPPGVLKLSDTTVSSNSATWNGGGIDNVEAQLTVVSSTFSGNTAGVAGVTDGLGGALDNYKGTATVSNTTIEHNNASYDGGGIFNWNTTPAGVVNLKDNIIQANTPDNCAGALSC